MGTDQAIMEGTSAPVAEAVVGDRDQRAPGHDDAEAIDDAQRVLAPSRGRWLGALLLRALFFLVIWLLLSAPDLGALRSVAANNPGALAAGSGAEIGTGTLTGISIEFVANLSIALIATAMATWISLWVLPPGPRAWRVSALIALLGRFLVQSVLGGIDVARRAFDPRLPLRPGYIVFATDLQQPRQRAILQTLTSATPGAIAAGTDAEGRLVFHCLDTRAPIAEGLARDERLLLRLYREDEPQ